MCLKPLKIRNPAKRIDLKGGQPLYIEVPCGHCAECKKSKRLEWYFRAYHQCQDTINHGGYVYFDTLTYSDDYIPKLSDFVDISDKIGITDFTCFNHTHWRNFLKNLRRQLHYYHIDVHFKYFLTSEYGTDPNATHRPHYHILFFISTTDMDPFEFSILVSKCWPYGRTDGLPYQSRRYVSEHCYGDNAGFDKSSFPVDICRKICNYVSKYVTKDSTFQDVVNSRITLLDKYIIDYDKLKEVKRCVDMFHRCSQGFGIGYLRDITEDEYNFLYNNGACRIGDKSRIVSVIKLPLYYKRKLFYDCLKRDDNTYYWQLNETGKDYQYNHLIKCIDNVTNNYALLLSKANDKEYSLLTKLLSDRTLQDFSIYKIFYQNRCRDVFNQFAYKDFMQKSSLNDDETNLYDWIQKIIHSSYVNSLSDFSICDCDDDGDNVFVNLSFGNLFNDGLVTHKMPKNEFIKLFRINENTCTAFRNFDKLDALFKSLNEPDNNDKQRVFDFLEDLTQKFKVLYYE